MTEQNRTAPKTAKRTRRSTNVPGQLYGYLVQVTRAVAHLLRARVGQAVSVEHLDDVATQGLDDVVAEQDKSGLAHNPVSDRSIDLWKTLHNWVCAIRDGALKSVDTKFVLYVAQDHHGDVIDRIHKIACKADADALIEALRDEFWGKEPDRSARVELPKDLAEHVNGVLQAPEVASLLFVNLTLENGSGSPNDDLLSLIAKMAIPESACEDVLKHLLGWAKRTIEKLIEKKQPAILTYEDFHKQLVGAARKFDRSPNALVPTTFEISQSEIEGELRARTYVRQLEAVKCDEADLVRAVNDFLRSAVERTTWSERGVVLEGSFGEFEDSLERAWQSQKARIEIEHRYETEEDRGRLVYANCSGLQQRLQGMDVPAHFVPGSFHTLAESLRVGWHPRYRHLLAPVGYGNSTLTEQQGEVSPKVIAIAIDGDSSDEGGNA